MTKISTIICLWLLLFPGTLRAEADLDEMLGGIRKNYGDLSGLTVAYKREVITKTMAMLGEEVKGDLATGNMFFKPPGLLRIEQKTPKQESVIYNEETLWWYLPHQKRVYKYPGREFGKELRLLSDIFRGLIRVDDRFQVSLLEPNALGEHQIKLAPQPVWQNIDRIILTVTNENTIRIVNITYQLGTTTIFTLNTMIEKKDFENDFFNFKAPEGVLLVEEEGVDVLQ